MYSPSDVKSAIAAKTLVPAFQRIVSLASGRIAGFEVLTRCLHPSLGPVLPDNFIHFAEELRLMNDITTQVAVQAIAVASALPNVGLLTINLSRSQFGGNVDLVRITAAARELSFPLERIILEVSEDTVCKDILAAEKNLLKFKNLGYRVALDNCGPRFAADVNLQQLGFDILKIDRRIAAHILNDERAVKTMRAIVALGKNLRASIIAMGVETRAQQTACQGTGCKFAEGYLFGRPVLTNELRRLLNCEEVAPAEFSEDSLAMAGALPDCSEPLSGTVRGTESGEIEPLVTWTEELSVGVKILDQDHQAIFAMLNEVHAAVHSGHPKDEIEAAIEQLVLCTLDHFDREEKLFDRTEFPAASLHRAQHENFRRRIYALQRRIETSISMDELKEIFPVLKCWLTDHLRVADREYRTHFNARGIS